MTIEKNGRLISDQYGCEPFDHLYYTQHQVNLYISTIFVLFLENAHLKGTWERETLLFEYMLHHQKHDEAANDYDG
jgi:hypothetical protein